MEGTEQRLNHVVAQLLADNWYRIKCVRNKCGALLKCVTVSISFLLFLALLIMIGKHIRTVLRPKERLIAIDKKKQNTNSLQLPHSTTHRKFHLRFTRWLSCLYNFYNYCVHLLNAMRVKVLGWFFARIEIHNSFTNEEKKIACFLLVLKSALESMLINKSILSLSVACQLSRLLSVCVCFRTCNKYFPLC